MVATNDNHVSNEALARADDFGRRLRDLDHGALEQFFELYFDRIFRHVQRAVGHPETAEDLTQEIFLRIHRSFVRYDPERELEPWVFTIVSNRIRDHWRAVGRRRVQTEGFDAAEETHPDGRERPDVELEDRETRDQLNHAIAGLPDGMRRTVELRTYDSLGFEAIGRVLGIDATAARKRYSRAVARLRELLQAVPTPA